MNTLITLSILSASTYFGVFYENIGLQNISFTILYISSAAMVFSVFAEPSENVNSKAMIYFSRLWFSAITFSLIYGGEIAIGVIFLLFLLVRILNKQHEKLLTENKG